MTETRLDCVVIGYNELPFRDYVQTMREFGEGSEAYRDLRSNFVEIDGAPLKYMDLLDRVLGGTWNLRSCDIPNLAAVYLTHFLERRGHRAEFINLFQEEKQRLAELLAAEPRCVAITTTFYVFNLPVNEMVQFIRQHNPRVPIIVGGVLISNHLKGYDTPGFHAALRDIGADIYVLESQGELTLHNLITAYQRGLPASSVPNIVYEENGVLRQTAAFVENNSMDAEAIGWDTLARYSLGKTVQTRTARSCAFNCSFCGYPERGGALTLASVETVRQELLSLRRLGNVENLVFIDDTFNVPIGRFKDICRMMIAEDFGFHWFSYYRCNHSDEEAIELMRRSGCTGVFLGVESGSQRMLDGMNKKAKVQQYLSGIEMLKARGILTFGSFIVGFPGETEETLEETEAFLTAANLDYWRATPWYCDPLTPVYRQGREQYGIEGVGYQWKHRTMNSLEAADHIERLVLTVQNSLWLPQYSFDFWAIPYLLGKGLNLDQLREFMESANRLLALELSSPSAWEKEMKQAAILEQLDQWAGEFALAQVRTA